MINLGVVGYGYWGPNLVRNFNQLDQWRVKTVCELQPKRLQALRKQYPAIGTTQDYRDILGDPEIDAVALATPVSTHFELAQAALLEGKHVLVEKPMASSTEQCLRLIELAEKKRKTLMVDHTFIYTGAVRKIRELIDAGELGQLLYFDSVRVNLGLIQNDVNVIWDLACHDLSIMDFLLGREPEAISAVGANYTGNHIANLAYLTVRFSDNVLAHFHVNWLAPVKVRLTLIGGTRKMVVYDDIEPSEKVRIYDKGVVINHSPEDRYKVLVGYRIGDVLIPKLDTTEALQRVCGEFEAAIREGRQPITGGEAGCRVVRLLEAAQASLDAGGHPVELKSWVGRPSYQRAAVGTP
jgi:predicted dehydrogenase